MMLQTEANMLGTFPELQLENTGSAKQQKKCRPEQAQAFFTGNAWARFYQ